MVGSQEPAADLHSRSQMRLSGIKATLRGISTANGEPHRGQDFWLVCQFTLGAPARFIQSLRDGGIALFVGILRIQSCIIKPRKFLQETR